MIKVENFKGRVYFVSYEAEACNLKHDMGRQKAD